MAWSMLLKKKKAKPGHQGQETEAHICAVTVMASKTSTTSVAPQSWREQVQHRTREHLQTSVMSPNLSFLLFHLAVWTYL